MADEEKTNTESTEQAPAPKKGGNKLVMFGGIGVGAVVIGIVLALFVIKPMMGSDTPQEEDGTEQVEKAHSKKKEKKPGEKNVMYSVENIVVNPAGTGGSRFLSVSFGFELKSETTKAEFEERDAVIRDALITIMSSKTVAQLTDAKQKEIARYQIKKRVSQLLQSNELVGVYYTDFVLQ